MKSPFPGMDPFIEACGLWGDLHSHLIEDIHRALSEVVPSRYLVRTGERAYVVLLGQEGKEQHPFLPDAKITGPAGSVAPGGRTAVAEAVQQTEPLEMQAFVAEEFRETFVEILDVEANQEVVTCIEVLSPTNKRPGSEGWKLYQRKRQALLLGSASLVEIDLLRGGSRMPMMTTWPTSPYVLLVSRRDAAPRCKVRPAFYRRQLPVIPVPLVQPDADVQLDLQPMIEAIYMRSRYHRSIDYSRVLDPPLLEDDATWLAERVREGIADGGVAP